MVDKNFNFIEVNKYVDSIFDCIKSTSTYVNPEFIKCFNKVIDKSIINKGWEITKQYFHTSLPQLLSTNYSGFWMYVSYNINMLLSNKDNVDIIKIGVQENKLKDLFKKLNYTYFLVFFNSLIKKMIPYNFDPAIWTEAVNRSKSRYFKVGLDYAAETVSKSVTEKTIEKFRLANDDKQRALILIKAYYELRHRTSQLVKPVASVYYKLVAIKRSTIGTKDNTLTYSGNVNLERFLVLYNEIVKNDNNNLVKFLKTRVKCRDENFFNKTISMLPVLNIEHIEFILKNLLNNVWDINFWKTDDIVVSIFNTKLNYPANDEYVECFLRIVYNIYLYFTVRKQALFEQHMFKNIITVI